MMKTDHAPDRAQLIDSATNIVPQQPAAALDSSGSAPRVHWSDNQRASALRRLSMLCLAILCTAAGGSAPNTTLIVGPRVELGPLQGLASNLGVTPVSGLIVDLNGDGAPDIVVGIDGGAPVV